MGKRPEMALERLFLFNLFLIGVLAVYNMFSKVYKHVYNIITGALGFVVFSYSDNILSINAKCVSCSICQDWCNSGGVKNPCSHK
jgi:hypothetical protein